MRPPKPPEKIWIQVTKVYTGIDNPETGERPSWYRELTQAFSNKADLEDHIYEEGLDYRDTVIACYQLVSEPKKKSARKAAKRNAKKVKR